jgi:DNA-binding XRE family transcriptional regulator
MDAPGRAEDDERVAAASDGRSLRAVRAERLLSRRELGQLAGVARSTIYLIEAGRTTPQFSVVRRLCEALEVDPQDIAEFRRAIRVYAAPRLSASQSGSSSPRRRRGRPSCARRRVGAWVHAPAPGLAECSSKVTPA